MTSQTSWAAMRPEGTPDVGAMAMEHLHEHGVVDAHVDQIDGHVYLRGTASAYKNKQAAARSIGAAMPGLVVINELRIVHEPTADGDVAASVSSAVGSATPDAAATMRVFAISGDVYLRGLAPDANIRARIEAAAWDAPGVMRVHNELSLPGHVDNGTMSHEIEAYVRRVVTMASGSLHVLYEDGVVCLDGDVGSAEQRDMIEELVRWHESVRDVTNNLQVHGRPNLS